MLLRIRLYSPPTTALRLQKKSALSIAIIIIAFLLTLSTSLYADDLVDFSDDSLPVLNENLRRMRSDIDRAPRIYTGTAAPTTTPYSQGDIFIDTTNSKVYIASGTDSSSNWLLMN